MFSNSNSAYVYILLLTSIKQFKFEKSNIKNKNEIKFKLVSIDQALPVLRDRNDEQKGNLC